MNHLPLRLLAASLLLSGAACTNPLPQKAKAPMTSTSEPAEPSTPPAEAAPSGPLSDAEAEKKALALVAHFVDAKYGDAVAMFDAPMAKAFTQDQVQATWQTLTEQLGAYRSAGVARVEHKDAMVRAIVSTEFEKAKVNLIVVFEPAGQVTGFFVKPAEVPWTAPAYAKSDGFTEEEVTVGEGELALPATLTLPKGGAGKLRAVVLVHGSGPNDRDETVGGTKTFKDLAWGLASRGIAVLRYEKVTRAHGAKFLARHGDDITLANETTDDALKAVALLRKDARIDASKIVYLGHSQGALAAPRAGKADPALAGLIIMAGPTRPLEDVGLAQLEYIATLGGANAEGAKGLLPRMREAAKLVKSPTLDAKTAKDKLPLGIPAPFWLDLRGYQPEQVAAGLKMPLLVLQGEADYQVEMSDFAGWQKGLAKKANAKLKSYPGLFHTFSDCGCKLATPKDYARPGNVAVAVIDDIESWIKAL